MHVVIHRLCLYVKCETVPWPRLCQIHPEWNTSHARQEQENQGNAGTISGDAKPVWHYLYNRGENLRRRSRKWVFWVPQSVCNYRSKNITALHSMFSGGSKQPNALISIQRVRVPRHRNTFHTHNIILFFSPRVDLTHRSCIYTSAAYAWVSWVRVPPEAGYFS